MQHALLVYRERNNLETSLEEAELAAAVFVVVAQFKTQITAVCDSGIDSSGLLNVILAGLLTQTCHVFDDRALVDGDD